MKRLIITILGLVTGTVLSCHAAGNNFTTNDLYLGFSQSSAQDDYIIDLGQPGAAGAGGTLVKDLSSEFSASVFSGVFTGGPVGVQMAVVGGNNTFNHGDIYATQLRTNNFGNPALPGSLLSRTNQSSGNLTTAVQVLTQLMLTTGGLPSTGGQKLDSSQSYLSIVESTSPTDFPAKSGIIPNAPISAASNIVMDLWMMPPSSLTNNYLGYFTFDLSTATPKLNFTPAGTAPTAPVAAFSGTPTAGSAPLQVVFTDASTGSITNWIWNFGDGNAITNTSNASVTNTYTSGGSYTVSLTVLGSGGANTSTRASYITVSSGAKPVFGGVTLSNGKLVLSGTNGSSGAQYRILTSTNIATGNWTPVFTNNFLGDGSFSYTNAVTTNGAGFFRLVSP